MTTDNGITFVNVVDVDPARQAELVALLQEGAERVIRHRPGFVSLTLLASTDGSRVVNLARWRSADDVRATQADPAAAEYASRTAAIAGARPGLYTVAAQYDA
ncbi:antibiotic biosynthesis monooxygenase family protein [Cellulomonas sp. FA1]|uniref:antibiotic biosynthesis monooxygenase family protein n=1 Tax=Cellulomonas sp. FA1 TaxID=1346710 RepID=UPI000625045C|nr:antibiotic biosynthesis monooxygenase [Cellulomonas sp. FA1]